jgi:hypothetical protein
MLKTDGASTPTLNEAKENTTGYVKEKCKGGQSRHHYTFEAKERVLQVWLRVKPDRGFPTPFKLKKYYEVRLG